MKQNPRIRFHLHRDLCSGHLILYKFDCAISLPFIRTIHTTLKEPYSNIHHIVATNLFRGTAYHTLTFTFDFCVTWLFILSIRSNIEVSLKRRCDMDSSWVSWTL